MSTASMTCDRAGQLELCVLASGSSGNCSVIRSPAGTLLIDAGLGPRVVGKLLAGCAPEGITLGLADIRAVCLTHLDSDHFNVNWSRTLKRYGIAVYCHESGIDSVARKLNDDAIDLRAFGSEAFQPLEGLAVSPVAFAHDAAGSHGFVIEGFNTRIGYATDLGRVPSNLCECFCDLDLLAIESNYDRQMQLDSERPWFLKQRIMNGHGHLSNAEAYEFVRAMFNRCEKSGRPAPRHVVLLHRSRECNCPDLLRRFFARDARIARRLVLSEQHEPTQWLCPGAAVGEQMMLAWG